MVLHFQDCYAQIQQGEVLVYWKDDALLYKEVFCDPQNQVESLNESIRSVMKHKTIPNHLPLFTIEERNYPVLMVKCVNSDPFSKAKIDWCFQKVPVSYDSSMNIPTSKEIMYLTVELKKFLFSIVNTVVAFLVQPFRPILDVKYMYVGEDNNVVFTHYESRALNHDWAYEASELNSFLITFGKNKARNSTTVREEIKSFGKSLKTLTHQQLQRNPKLISQNVIFWNVEMRVMYIIELHDLMENNQVLVYPACANAFDNTHGVDFRTMITMSNNVVLMELFESGDRDYKAKAFAYKSNMRSALPSIMRSHVLGSTPKDILCQGLTRIRDTYRHAFKNLNTHHSLEEIQHLFQHVFPMHMIEFAKVQSNLTLDVEGAVNASLSAPPLKTSP